MLILLLWSYKFNPLPVVDLGPKQTICDGDSITLDAGNAGYTFTWSTSETTQAIIAKATDSISVIVSDTIGCADTAAMNLQVNPIPVVNLGNDTTICAGNSVVLLPTYPGYIHRWSTGETTEQINPTTSNTYHVRVEDTIGCADADTIVLQVNPLPVVDLGPKQTICDGDSITLDAGNAGNAGYAFAWDNGATTQRVTLKSSTTIEVIVSDTIGCADTSAMELQVNPIPIINLGNDTTICMASPLQLQAGYAGYAHYWSTGERTESIQAMASNTYSVTVSDTIGCSGSDTMILQVNPIPALDLGGDKTICEGDSITLDASNPGYNSTWNTTASSQQINISVSGLYSVVVSDSIQCAATDEMTLTVIERSDIELDYSAECAQIPGGILSYFAFDDFDNTQWLVNDSTVGEGNDLMYTFQEGGDYKVALRYEVDGCSFKDSIEVPIRAFVLCQITIPNTFTPNGDGINDTWFVENIEHYPEVEVSIFNRWGELLVSQTGYQNDWDGTGNGKQLEEGTYFYIFNFGEFGIKKGTVTIIK